MLWLVKPRENKNLQEAAEMKGKSRDEILLSNVFMHSLPTTMEIQCAYSRTEFGPKGEVFKGCWFFPRTQHLHRLISICAGVPVPWARHCRVISYSARTNWEFGGCSPSPWSSGEPWGSTGYLLIHSANGFISHALTAPIYSPARLKTNTAHVHLCFTK